jgi:hypothetical protein
MTSAKSKFEPIIYQYKPISYVYVFCLLAIFFSALATVEFSIGKLYLRAMPQDLFFQLDGIYRLAIGQRIYSDFSTPIGPLIYVIPLLFVKLGANLALSINYASGFLLIAAFAVVAYVAWTRLSPLFGLALGVWVGLALATRMNFGDDPAAVTLAMNYNRQGYAALVLAMLMFRAPRNVSSVIAPVDGVVYAILTAFLIYTKITFGLVAIAFAPIVIWPQHSRLVVLSAFAISLGILVSVAEYGYGLKFQWIEPVRMAIQSGDPATSALAADFSALILNLPELLVCTLVPAWFLWSDHRLTPPTIIFFIMVAGASVGLMPHNGQHYFLFLPAILFFIAAPPVAQLSRGLSALNEVGRGARWQQALAIVTITVLALESGPQAVNLFYATYRSLTSPALVIDNNVLGRIVARAENYEDPHKLLIGPIVDGRLSAVDAFAVGRFFKPEYRFDTLTMLEYRDYLADGMQAARLGCQPDSRILTFDNGNPFPLLLTWPTGGGMLVVHPDRLVSKKAHPSDDEMFRNINCVLVPKLPASLNARDFMLDVYGRRLSQKFAASYETPLWKVFKLSSPG